MTLRQLKKLFKSSGGNNEIDPDEIFLDSRNLPNFDVHQFEGRIEKPISKNVFRGFVVVFFIFTCLFFGKLWILQINMGQAYEIRSANNSLRNDTIFAERGIIYDRNHVPLAWNVLNPGDDFSRRVYSTTTGLADLIGSIKYPQKDSSGVYYNEQYQGVGGVEAYFDSNLEGQNGLKITETDVAGHVVSESTISPPADGKNLTLTIDSRVQSELYDVIAKISQDHDYTGGSGIIMDVHTGEILAMTSYPEYDSNIMSDGTDTAAINKFLTNKDNPFINRAISGLYIPGSIIKPFIAMGVLEEGIISPTKKLLSTGAISIQDPYDPSKRSYFRDWEAHGWIDLRQAISQSSDEYFYMVGGGYGDQKGLGIDNIDKYVNLFGIGGRTGINLFGEAVGNIPSPEWKKVTFNGEPWYLGDTYHSSIGQYGFQVTPIEMVRAIASFANGGKLVTPSITFVDPANATTTVQLPFSPENYQIIREGMRLSATVGVASGLNMPNLAVAAKSGTAELGVRKIYVNSLIEGYFPYDNPRYAFIIILEHGPKGNTVNATYAMRQVLDWMTLNTPEYTK